MLPRDKLPKYTQWVYTHKTARTAASPRGNGRATDTEQKTGVRFALRLCV
jgi:hypothetical protein